MKDWLQSAPRKGNARPAANCERMDAHREPDTALDRVFARRVAKRGLRPRVAASLIAILWLIATVVFGIVEHLIDPQTFDTIWEGMWWATQTVTTVGYGDVVPADVTGKLIAALLMIGGLSLFAVVTGAITSAFVARAQFESREEGDDPVLVRLGELEAQVAALRADLALQGPPEEPPGPS
jgi:voltage-gated potassium channel